MKKLKRLTALLMAVVMMAAAVPAPVFAAGGIELYADKINRGKTGKTMSVSFTIRNNTDQDLKDIKVGFDVSGADDIIDEEEGTAFGYSFPFEITNSLPTTDNPKNVGKLDRDKEKTVSLSGTVRRDLKEGYYKVPVAVVGFNDEGRWEPLDVTVWISPSTGTDSEDDETKTYDFVLGEGQNTPDGTYPNVMNFSINLRNNSPSTVYNVKASLVLDSDSVKFPFEINDAKYDRMFETIGVDET